MVECMTVRRSRRSASEATSATMQEVVQGLAAAGHRFILLSNNTPHASP